MRLQLLVRRHRLGDGGAAAREAGRHHPRARRRSTNTTATSTPTTPPSIAPCRSTARTTSPPTARRRCRSPSRRPATARSIFDGDGNFALFDVRAADYTYFEGITFRNAEIAILAGTQFIAGSKGLTVKRSRFENVGAGVFTNYRGLEQLLHRRQHVHRAQRSEAPDRMVGEFWTQVQRRRGAELPAGDGVVRGGEALRPGPRRRLQLHRRLPRRHQRRDLRQSRTARAPADRGSSTARSIRPREYWDRRPVAIDFYNNYITNSHDNPIETDGSMHNIRVMRNMLINSRVARVLQSADARRAGLLDPQHRLQPARRLDAADQRLGRRDLLQQHDPVGDVRKSGRTCTGATT